MIEITVKLQLDENSSDAKRALAALFGLPNFSSYCPGVSEENEQAETPAPTPQAEQKVEEAKLVVNSQPEPEKVEKVKSTSTAKKSYKIEDVRAAMASKLTDHRVELVNKLKEMGAKNVSSLLKDKYEEFINFCNSL